MADALGVCIDIDNIICKPQAEARVAEFWTIDNANDIAGTIENLTNIFVDGECALYFYPSAPSLGRCMPDLSVDTNATDAILEENEVAINENGDQLTVEELRNGFEGLLQSEATGFVQRSLADLQESWPAILIILGISVVVSFIWIFLMRWIAAPLIWIFIFGLLGLMGFGLYFCFDKWNQITNETVGEGNFFCTTDANT